MSQHPFTAAILFLFLVTANRGLAAPPPEPVVDRARESLEQDRKRRAEIHAQVKTLIDAAVAEHAEPAAKQPAAPKIALAQPTYRTSGRGARYTACVSAFAEQHWSEKFKTSRFTSSADDLFARCAGNYLTDRDPARRAAACELLSYYPVETIRLGFFGRICNLTGDRSVAYKMSRQIDDGPYTQTELPRPPRYETVEITVGKVAQSAVQAIVGISFPDAAMIPDWWKANSDYRTRLWYWRMRDHNFAGHLPGVIGFVETALLETLEPEQALKAILLSRNEQAISNEFKATLDPETIGLKTDWRLTRIQVQNWGKSYYPQEVARFVETHKLQRVVFDLLRNKVNWPELGLEDRYSSAAGEAIDQIVRALPWLLTSEDVPDLESLLAEPTGPLARVDRKPYWQAIFQENNPRTEIIRLAVDLAPDRAEAILVDQLKNHPSTSSELAIDLIRLSKLKHWKAIKAACLRDPLRFHLTPVVRAIGEVDAPEKRRALAELVTAMPLDYPFAQGEAEGPSKLLVEFAKVAAQLNDGKAVAAAEQLEAIRYREQRGKGGGLTDEEKAHNREIPQKQKELVKQLGDFFARGTN